MDRSEIARLRDTFREPGFGTMSVEDLVAIERLVKAHRPRSFLELGTASGLSSAIIAHMLDEHGGVSLMTVDLLDHFYGDGAGDHSRPAGFVIPAAYQGDRVQIARRTGWTSIDVALSGFECEMALVDGGHAHPWPLIDTLCVNVVLTGSRLVIEDDLTLFKRRPGGRGVGPKHLFDQFPASHREVFAEGGGNLFALSLDLPPDELKQIAIDGFALPWTLRNPILPEVVANFHELLRREYDAELADAFAKFESVFNTPNDRRRQAPR